MTPDIEAARELMCDLEKQLAADHPREDVSLFDVQTLMSYAEVFAAEVEHLTNENAELLLGLTATNDATDRLTAWKKAVEQAPTVAHVDGDDAHRKMLWDKDFASFDLAIGTELITRPAKEPQA